MISRAFLTMIAFSAAVTLANAEDLSWRRLVQTRELAAKCSIAINQSTLDWISAMTATVEPEQLQKWLETSTDNFSDVKRMGADQLVPFCWSLRRSLAADGWL